MKVLISPEGVVETIQLPEESTQEEYQGLLLIEAPDDILSGDHYDSETQEWIRDSYQRDPQPEPKPEPEPEPGDTETRLKTLEKSMSDMDSALNAILEVYEDGNTN